MRKMPHKKEGKAPETDFSFIKRERRRFFYCSFMLWRYIDYAGAFAVPLWVYTLYYIKHVGTVPGMIPRQVVWNFIYFAWLGTVQYPGILLFSTGKY